jgi:asparagine synthase (glutamine-hydrolysing)
MSGICGFCQPGIDTSTSKLALMLSVLASNESLPQETRVGRSVAMGVVRRWDSQMLGVIPRVRIAIDGDLSNEREIARLLEEKRIDPQGLSLGERLAQLYLWRGPDFLKDLKGAFALALWDEAQQRLLLAIDRFGFKRLCWSREGDALLFATNTAAVRAARQQVVEVNPSAVLQYLLFSVVPAPLGIYRGISKLLPGVALTYENGQIHEQAYWELDYSEDQSYGTRHWAREVREGIRGAVDRQLEGCDPEKTGAYLSGGTDSSSVVAFMSERCPSVHTFSISFPESRYNEIGYARLTADHFRAKYHELCLNPDDAIATIPKLMAYYDEPFGNSSAIGSYCCARLARESGMDTLLAGDGGDELFAGNERYASDKYFSLYHDVPGWFRKGVIEPFAGLLPSNGGPLSLPRRYIRRAKMPNPLRIFSYGLFLSVPPEEVFEAGFLEDAPKESWMAIANRHFHNARAKSELNRMMYLDLKLILADNDLRKVNGTAELAGIRVRYPMLDDRLAELSGRIPTRLKLKGFKKRYIFKEAMRGILPDEVLSKKKHGFGVPLGIWLLQEPRLKTLVQDVLGDSRTRQRGYLLPKFYERLRELHRSDHAAYYGEVVWYLLALELWHRQHFDCLKEVTHAR